MLISYLCSIIKGRVPRTRSLRSVSTNGRGRRALCIVSGLRSTRKQTSHKVVLQVCHYSSIGDSHIATN